MIVTAIGCHQRDNGNEPEERSESEADERPADAVTLSKQAIERSGIETGVVKKERLRPTFRAPARVTFNEEAVAHIGTPVPGRVIEIKVRLGDLVEEGDTLMIVESPELADAQSDYLQKRSAIGTAESALKPAKLSYERGLKLYEQNQGIALSEVQKREADYKAAQKQLETAETAANSAQQKLQTLGMSASAIKDLERYGKLNSKQLIIAPIASTVIQREVTLGELVSPDKETLILLADMTKLWVIVDVPEARFSDVAVGARAWVHIGGTTAKTLEGKVSLVAPSIDAETRSVQVRLDVSTQDVRIAPGMFAEAEIEIAASDYSSPVIAVPESAVQTIEGTAVVFVVDRQKVNTFNKRPIKVGSSIGGMVSVPSGLDVDETIVTEGSFVLKAELGKSQAEEDE